MGKIIGILASLVNYDKLWIGGGNAAHLTIRFAGERGDGVERGGHRGRRTLLASEIGA